MRYLLIDVYICVYINTREFVDLKSPPPRVLLLFLILIDQILKSKIGVLKYKENVLF